MAAAALSSHQRAVAAIVAAAVVAAAAVVEAQARAALPSWGPSPLQNAPPKKLKEMMISYIRRVNILLMK